MKHTLTTEVELLEDLQVHVQAHAMRAALWDVADMFRSKVKYVDFETEEAALLAAELKDKFHQILGDHNVTLD